MNNKPLMNSSEFDDDFGFTAVDEQQLTELSAPVRNERDDAVDRLQKMYDSIIPLLKNLNANPDKEYIHWPNRKDKIAKFKAKLDSIGSSYIKVKPL